MQELMTINVVIGDRTYRIKIEQRDEEVVRRTLRTINDKIIEYKTQFAGRDMQDYIAMVLLWYATQASSAGGDRAGRLSAAAMEALTRMEQQLDKVI
jgi:Cell division protein ZapA